MESLALIQKYMDKTKTWPHTQTALLTTLQKWQQQALVDWQSFDPDMALALQRQTSIGWQALLEGLPAKQWKDLQMVHYNSIDCDKSPK